MGRSVLGCIEADFCTEILVFPFHPSLLSGNFPLKILRNLVEFRTVQYHCWKLMDLQKNSKFEKVHVEILIRRKSGRNIYWVGR